MTQIEDMEDVAVRTLLEARFPGAPLEEVKSKIPEHYDIWEDMYRTQVRESIKVLQPAFATIWDEGFTRGFYDPLAGGERDASESTAKNPYEEES